MKFLKTLFGSKPIEETVETYKDFRIIADPMREGSKFRLAARIEKDEGGEVKVHHVIRADTFESLDKAKEVSIAKAKQVIDEQYKTLFS